MLGRQIRVDFKIEQNLRVAVILHGKSLPVTGFRAVNLLTRNEEEINYEGASEVAIR